MSKSFYLVNALRLWLVQNGDFAKIKSAKFYKLLKDAFEKSSYDNLDDFIYSCLGYSNDTVLSPYDRAMKRKEIMQNIENDEYWENEAERLEVEVVSKVVNTFAYQDVLGLGKSYTNDKANVYSFNKLETFLEENEELVDIFCTGADIMYTNLYYSNVRLKFTELRTLIKSDSYKDYLDSLNRLNVNATSVFDLEPSKYTKLEDGTLHLPRETVQKYGKNFLCRTLLYCYLISAHRIPIKHMDNFKNYVGKGLELFLMSDIDFLFLVDLAWMCDCKVIDLLNRTGYTMPSVNEMINLSHGIYLRKIDGSYMYIPEHMTDVVGAPCVFEANSFVELINNGLYSLITYSKGIPYFNGTPVYSLNQGGLHESHSF